LHEYSRFSAFVTTLI